MAVERVLAADLECCVNKIELTQRQIIAIEAGSTTV